MSLENKLDAGLAGVCGEYFVAAELSRRGYVASITLRNTAGVDILCSRRDASRSIEIQVKTTRDSTRSWILNKKAENYRAANLFYVFVRLNGLDEPAYHVVPSCEVAEQISSSHQEWLSGQTRGGGQRKDLPLRRFIDKNDAYLDKWGLLGL